MYSPSIALLVSLAGWTAAECSRSTLQSAVDAYIGAVKSGSSGLDVAAYPENFNPSDFKAGIHSKPIKVSLSRSLLDTTACASFTEIMAHENSPPMVIGTQMHYSGSKVTKMETIYNTKENGWIADPAVTFQFASKEKRDIIPDEKRDTRTTIRGVADAYLDRFSNVSITIPRLSPCERLEGKMHVYPDCTAGMPNSPSMKMTNRRYVIDEAFGTVSVFLNFGAMPDSHEYRVEGGKLRYVHAITVAKGGGRGRNRR
jgi:hypothetical protein